MKYQFRIVAYGTLSGIETLKFSSISRNLFFFNENLSFFNLVSDLLVSETSQKTRFDWWWQGTDLFIFLTWKTIKVISL